MSDPASRTSRLIRSGGMVVHGRLPVAWRLLLGMVGLALFGTLLLSLPGMTTSPLPLGDRLFTATSAVTVTGLTVVTTSTAFTPLGQFVLLGLIQIGGLGYVVLVVLGLRLLGRHVALAERMALASELGIGKTYSIFEILKRTLGLMIIVEGLGAAILFVYWSLIDKVPDGRTLFFAIFHSVAAFCNAGFDLFTGLPGYVPGPPIDHLTVLVLGVIVILGGLGIPVYLDILKRRKIGSRFSTQTRVTVVISLVLVFAGMGALLVTEYWLGGALAGVPWGSRVVVAWFQSVVARTAGFPGLSTFAPLKPASILVLMALMFIGSGPASMGGGITTGSFTVVLMAVGNFVRGNTRARLARRSVSPETVLRATTIITVATLAIAGASFLILLTNPFGLQEVVFEVISAFSTVGLSLGITADLNPFGRWVIMAMMIWGRLGAMTVVVALTQHKGRQSLVEYPEAELLVG
ncbi:MAG: hypothetical protein MUO23_08090 [Anaerolineales bacterium]|nr:hypothetical protein [Anaerolineales bacterium]